MALAQGCVSVFNTALVNHGNGQTDKAVEEQQKEHPGLAETIPKGDVMVVVVMLVLVQLV
jgi:hypothetical protein